MGDQLHSELLRATNSTFEQLGFVFPDTELDDRQAEAPLAFTARVAFTGPVHGVLQISVSDDVATELAINMLGLFDSPDDGVKRDALGEIANVVCGNLVPTLGKPEHVFDLSAPALSGPVETTDEGTARLEVGIEDGRAEISIFLRDAPATAGAS